VDAGAGVRDRMRTGDARTGGTAFGAILMHVIPGAAAGRFEP